MAKNVPTVCHFPGHLPDYASRTSFAAGLGLYKMVDVTPITGDDGEVTVMYNFENPRDDPKNVLFAPEPSIPLLPPHKAYVPGYTTSYPDIFKKQAHLQVLPQFMNLIETYPSLALGPMVDKDLVKKWKPLRKHAKAVERMEDFLFLGCPRDLLLDELHAELDYRGIEKHANHLHHGGCMCFVPVADDGSNVAGFLVYPSGAAMDILTVLTLSSYLEPSSSWVRLNPKPDNEVQRIRFGGVIRQVETVRYRDKKKHFCIVRTDYQSHVIQISLSEDGNVTMVKVAKTIQSQHRLTSVALSPFIQQEYVCSLDSSEVILAESNDRLLRSEAFPSADRKHNPIFCHFGAHPREVFVHDQKEAFIYDFRCPIRTKRSLFKLPHTCLSTDQRFSVARQHPMDLFYNYIATQDALLLLDQRFPEHPVIQTYHNVLGLPSYLEVSQYVDTHPRDIVMAGNHNEKQVHCFFVNCNDEPHKLSSSIWKISPYHDWPEMLDDSNLPPVTEEVWDRLNEPLLGFTAAQVSVGYETSWNVIQISAAGDVFLQTFSAPSSESHPRQSITSGVSQHLCDLWLRAVTSPDTPGPMDPPQRCRKRPWLEYHPACERCGGPECIVGGRPIHGLPRALDRVRKNKTVDKTFVSLRGKELQDLWAPQMCQSCTDLCVKDWSMYGEIRTKNRGYLRSLRLPWEQDLEQSKVTFMDQQEDRKEDSTPGTPVQDTEKPATTSRIEISAEDGHSSLVVPYGECEVPLSQASFNVTDPDIREEAPSFRMILQNKKMKAAGKQRRSGEQQTIGF